MLRIKELMSEKGVKSIELSEMIGISTVGISNLINGKTKPAYDTLERISGALNVPMWQLFASPDEIQGNELLAFVKHKGEIYEASTIKELQNIIDKIRRENG